MTNDALSPIESDRLAQSERLRQEARSDMRLGEWESALAKLSHSASLYPQSITYELIGECHLARLENDQAIIYFSAACGLGNKQYKPRVQLARLLYSLGELHEHQAVFHLLMAQRMNPSYKAAKELLQSWLASNARISVVVAAQQESSEPPE